MKRLLYIFVCDDENILNEIYEGDEIMAKVREEINDLTHELDKYLYYDKDALDRAYKQELAEEIEKELKKQITEKITEDVTKKVTEDVTKKVTEDVTKKVMKQGIEQGIAMEKNNIVKRLLENEQNMEYISMLTELSIDEITEIKRGL